MSQSSWWHRLAELQTIRGNWIIIWRVRWKQIRFRMTESPGFSSRQLISTNGLDTFHSESRVRYQNTYSGTKSFIIVTDWFSWSQWTTVSLIIWWQMGLIIARAHIECHSVRERDNNIFPVAFWNQEQPNYRTSRSLSIISCQFGLIYVWYWV
jgi:hypothetical protein